MELVVLIKKFLHVLRFHGAVVDDFSVANQPVYALLQHFVNVVVISLVETAAEFIDHVLLIIATRDFA